MGIRQQECTICRQLKPLTFDFFCKSASNISGHRKQCKVCLNTRRKLERRIISSRCGTKSAKCDSPGGYSTTVDIIEQNLLEENIDDTNWPLLDELDDDSDNKWDRACERALWEAGQ